MIAERTAAISVSILVADNARYIVLRCPPRYLGICRSIAGGRWSKALQAWSYPCTAAVAVSIRKAFSKENGVDISQEIIALSETQARASKAKEIGATLDPIPLTKTKPWRHQLAGYHFAEALPATMLAMEMRTGKSKVVVDLVVNHDWTPVLILCPSNVVGVWPDQFATHGGKNIPVLALDTDESVATKTRYAIEYLERRRKANEQAVIVINFEAAWREPFAKWALNIPWYAVVLDESHRIKAPAGTTSRFCAQLGRRALRRLCLTGTPTPHSPLDIYAQYRFLDPGIFGSSYSAFKQAYAVQGGFGGHQVLRFQNQQDLERRMGTIMFRVTQDVLDLPPSIPPVFRKFSLSRSAQATYGDFERLMAARVEDGEITATNVLVKILRLAQMTSGHIVDDDGTGHTIDTGKREALADYLEDLPKHEPVVVFGRFHYDLDIIQDIAKKSGRRFAELSGRRRDALTANSKLSPDCEIAAVQIQSGGVGVDFSRSHYAAYYSLSHSLGDYDQSKSRFLGSDQKQSVLYTHFIAKGTVDETIYNALVTRKKVNEAILDRLKYLGGK